MSFVETLMKPLLDEAYNKGFSAGVSAEKLKEKHDLNDRELYLYEYGYKMGVADTKAECGVIEEISAEEFDRLASEPEQPRTEIPDNFGFVGTIDDLSLALDEEAV